MILFVQGTMTSWGGKTHGSYGLILVMGHRSFGDSHGRPDQFDSMRVPGMVHLLDFKGRRPWTN